jgi:glyoxylase-like metal-dependent hydrolase (beta-lactamase superfamily II)
VTDVVLTHLHFDHCGGAVSLDRSKERYYPTFPNATYWSCEEHWNWATNPNEREKASFLKENILPIEEAGQLKFVTRNGRWSKEELFPGFRLFFADGHTESQMIPYIDYKDQTLIFAADLLPSAAHLPMPYVMGYDVRPLETLKEKKIFLDDAAEKDRIIFLEHDIDHECIRVHETEKGVRLKEAHTFKDIFGD